MPTQVQRRRGTTAQHAAFTGAEGELTYDTNKKTFVAHDGTRQGGYALQHELGYSVKAAGAKGDGSTDDGAAITAAINSGNPVVILPPGNYFVSTTIAVTASNVRIVGYGATIVRAATIGSGSTLTATSRSNLEFEGLSFTVASGTAHTSTGGHLTLTTCQNISFVNCKFSGKIPGLSSQRESLITLVSLPGCDDVTAIGNYFEYAYGNATGAADNVGTGLVGKRHSYVANVFYNCVDTSLGIWTNASDVSVVGNRFKRDDYTTSYNGVFIDVAGGTNVTIQGNQFVGNTIQVRVIQNLNYTNRNVVIHGNTFTGQVNGSGETGQSIKLAHATSTDTTSRESDVTITGNVFKIPAAMWGLDIVSTVADTSKPLRLLVDGNTFNIEAAGCYGVIFQKSGVSGAIIFSPGKNTFYGSGGTATAGNFPNTLSVKTSTGGVAHRSQFQFTGSTDANLVTGHCERGFYCINISLGTCTDVTAGGSLNFNIKGTATYLTNYAIISASGSNFKGSLAFNHITQDDVYHLFFDSHPAGHTHNYDYLQIQRVI